jgi:hypothetical protein
MSARSLVYTDEDGTILKPQLNEDESWWEFSLISFTNSHQLSSTLINFHQLLKNSLIIHEENTKEMNV